MNRLPIPIFATLTGALIGYLAVKTTRSSPTSFESPSEHHSPLIQPPVRSSRQDPHTFDALFRQMTPGNSPLSDLGAKLEHLSLDELRSLLIMASQPQEKAAVRRHIGVISAELYQRQGLAALDWAFETNFPLQGETLRSLLYPACREASVDALPLLKRFMKDYGDLELNNPTNFIRMAEIGSASRGAESLAEFYNSDFRGMSRGGMPYTPNFPDEFDFEKLAELTKDPSQLPASLKVWASRDPDSARSFVETLGDPRLASIFFRPYFEGLAACEGDAEAARAVVSLLLEQNSDHRSSALKALHSNDRLSGQETVAILQALPDPSDRLVFAGEALSPWTPSATTDAIFAVFPTPAERTDLLIQIAPSYRLAISGNSDFGDDVLTFFEDTMDRLDLPSESRKSVLDSLHQPPEQP
jgi:hypothetical protein